jgi:hypothetical protein
MTKEKDRNLLCPEITCIHVYTDFDHEHHIMNDFSLSMFFPPTLRLCTHIGYSSKRKDTENVVYGVYNDLFAELI